MKIKKVTKEQLFDVLKNDVRSFNYDIDKSVSKTVEDALKNPEHFTQDHILNQFVCLNDKDKIVGNMLVSVENSNYDETKLLSACISSVSTLPEYRTKGCIREIFEYVLPKLYDDGVCLSQLFPFSQNYYRQFGYEVCSKSLDYEWQLNSLPEYKYNGYFEPAYTPDHINDVIKIHNEFSAGFNLALERNRGTFFHNFKNTEKNTKENTYTTIYYSKDKNPSAFFTYKLHFLDKINYIEIKDLSFVDIGSLKAVLAFVKKSFISQCTQVKFYLPDFFDLTTFFGEDRSLQPHNNIILNQNSMVRVINVKKILENSKYIGSGELSISIEDKQISKNNGIYIVKFENGKAVSVTMETGGVFDVFMPINVFSRLIIGGLDTRYIPWVDNVKFACSLEKLGKVFYKKQVGVLDKF